MKLKDVLLIGLLLALSLLYTWYETNRPQPVNWQQTYSPKDKIPYGTYIVYHSLPELFPQSRIRTSRQSLAEEFAPDKGETTGVYIYINRTFLPDPREMAALMNWVKAGNEAFVVAEQMADTLLNYFSLGIKRNSGDSTCRLTFGDFKEKIYPFPGLYQSYFVLPDQFPGEVLGRKSDSGEPDFIRIPHGEGQLFLNLHPKVFTNRWILDTICEDYYYKALSWLPDKKQTLIWDAYTTLGREGMHTPLRVILNYPALKLALYLLLLLTLLYVLFQFKRRQRAIPVVRAPENKMLEFVTMISSLYYKQEDHTNIARKEIDFFLEQVRTKYHLPTDVLDARFVRLLSERSGIEEKKVEEVIQLIKEIKEAPEVGEMELRALMKGTEIFMKLMNNSK